MIVNEDVYIYSVAGIKMFDDIYPLFCGKEKCLPRHFFGPAVREYYLLHICCSGKGRFYSKDYQGSVEEGQCFLIYPQETTFYQADEEAPWSYAWIAFDGEKVEKYLELFGISREHPVCDCCNVRKAESYIDDILNHNTLEVGNEFYIQGEMMKLFAELIQGESRVYQMQSKKENLYISKAIEYIQLHYHDQITVQEIADFIPLNRSYLTDIFMKTIHMTPSQFLMEFRMKQAATELVYSNDTVTQIAYSCGYDNIASFSKAFKRVNGCSPSVWRKRETEKELLYRI